ncbi:MAG: amidohydrolase family protein, partial [Acidobacteria bacterium]|nr:amidohydrolase family protein [Acidobacteriota bacterium]
YRDAWAAHEKDSSRVPPRRDLQLDALVEIMAGERLVHSHSYRADEIVMLLRVAEDFGFTISSFQHVLEGYKVADELAAGKAGASTFSDWWAYKFEVIDAIPYNGAIMWDRGVVVSFNSDSSDLARRLNTEAAKAVRYGGVPEAEALKFVTLNPAIQLGIDDRVGSLEKGKDADFVIWSGHPLSTYTICEQTWIDGRKYFDREDDLIAREAIAAERQELLAKVRAEAEKEEEEDKEDEDEGEDKAEEEPEEAR